MTQNVVRQEVLTLQEAARYLRLPPASVKKHAERGDIPGRQIGKQWRFLKSALNEWLGRPDSRRLLLSMAGAFKNDETLPELTHYRAPRPDRVNGVLTAAFRR